MQRIKLKITERKYRRPFLSAFKPYVEKLINATPKDAYQFKKVKKK